MLDIVGAQEKPLPCATKESGRVLKITAERTRSACCSPVSRERVSSCRPSALSPSALEERECHTERERGRGELNNAPSKQNTGAHASYSSFTPANAPTPNQKTPRATNKRPPQNQQSLRFDSKSDERQRRSRGAAGIRRWPAATARLQHRREGETEGG